MPMDMKVNSQAVESSLHAEENDSQQPEPNFDGRDMNSESNRFDSLMEKRGQDEGSSLRQTKKEHKDSVEDLMRGRLPQKHAKGKADSKVQNEGKKKHKFSEDEDKEGSSKEDKSDGSGSMKGMAEQMLGTMQRYSSDGESAETSASTQAEGSRLSNAVQEISDKVSIMVSDPSFGNSSEVTINFKNMPALERAGLADGSISISMVDGHCKILMQFPEPSSRAHELVQSLQNHLKERINNVDVGLQFGDGRQQQHGDQQQGRSRGQRNIYDELEEQ